MFKRCCQGNFDWLIALPEHFRINIRVVGATGIEPVTLPCQGNRTSIKSNRYGEKDALNDRIPPLINKENFVFALELLWNRVPHPDEVGIE
jgi:hypothetical protein